MSSFWRNRRGLLSAGKEIGCGLITMIVFTAPLWVFSMATRGPRFALAVLALAILALILIFAASRARRR